MGWKLCEMYGCKWTIGIRSMHLLSRINRLPSLLRYEITLPRNLPLFRSNFRSGNWTSQSNIAVVTVREFISGKYDCLSCSIECTRAEVTYLSQSLHSHLFPRCHRSRSIRIASLL